ncbi:MAG: SAP domain-containing protein [Eubacteriales bacterium]|nr:SAP domain-containing protein [Eubacteriales bacterium]
MSLFDIFRKNGSQKKSSVSVSSTSVSTPSNAYDPWGENGIAVNNDYAIAAFVRMSLSGAKIGHTNDDYARYFNYRFGIHDLIDFHKKVIAEGYLVKAPADTVLRKLKMDQLKSILVDAGLPAKGKKDELVSKIAENIGFSSLGLETYYVPSKKGEAHLKKYEYIFAVEKYEVSADEYEKQRELSPYGSKPNDIIWQVLSNSFNKYQLIGDYGLARNRLLNMAQLLEEEKRNADALLYFCLVLYYDTSGCSNGRRIDDLEDVIIAPAIANAICKLKQYYDPQIINRCYERYALPHHYISKQNFEKLLFAIFNESAIDIHDFAR